MDLEDLKLRIEHHDTTAEIASFLCRSPKEVIEKAKELGYQAAQGDRAAGQIYCEPTVEEALGLASKERKSKGCPPKRALNDPPELARLVVCYAPRSGEKVYLRHTRIFVTMHAERH